MITIKSSVKIIDNTVIKKSSSNVLNTYNYLLSRSFNYFPRILDSNKDYIKYEYIPSTDESTEEKILDIMNLLSLLHSKTTYYKELDIDIYKSIYENISYIIEDTYTYYDNLINVINNIIYMSPPDYLIARNISIIFNALKYSKDNLDSWYKSIEKLKKVRLVTIHNNVSLEHFIKNNDKSYLISWDNSKKDMPIYDIISLYKKHYLDIDFTEGLNLYLSKYPLTNEEKTLLFVILSIPDKIKYNKSNYITTVNIRKNLDYIYKTSALLKNFPLEKEDIEE